MTILQVKDLHKSFGASTHVLRGINLKVEQGEFLGVIGLSGAGKSTIAEILANVLTDTCNTIKQIAAEQRAAGILPC